MYFSRLFFALVLASPLLLNSCASILNSKTQDVKIKTQSSETKVYKEGEKVGEGPTVQVPLKRDRNNKQFILKRKGYKDEYRVISQYKNSPWKIMSWIPFSALMFMPPLLDDGKKSKDFKDQYSYKVNTKIEKKDDNQKYVLLNNTVFDLEKKDFRFYFLNPKSYYEGETSEGFYIYAKEKMKFEDDKVTNSINTILENNGFIDTTERIITTNNNTLYINAEVKDVFVNRITENDGGNTWTNFVITETSIEWEVLNAYGQKKYSTTTEVTSGEFDSEYWENPVYQSMEDALQKGFFTFVQEDTVKRLLKKQKNLEKEFDKTLSLNKGKEPQTLGQAQKATVTITNKEGHGSGVVVGKNGHIITNYHVALHDKLKVIANDGTKLKPEIVRKNKKADLCLLKVDKSFEYTFHIPNKPTYKAGQEVYTIGTPSSKELGQTLSKGIISGIRKNDNWKLLQMDASVNPGSSGGALTNKQGQLLGIVNAKMIGYGIEGIGFSIPAERTRDLLSLQ